MMKNNFENKELDILRTAIDNASSISGKKLVQSEDIKNNKYIRKISKNKQNIMLWWDCYK